MPEGKQENKSFRVDLDFQTFRFRLLSRARRRAEVKSGGGRQSWAQTERGAIRDKSLKSATISLEEEIYSDLIMGMVKMSEKLEGRGAGGEGWKLMKELL